MELTRRHALVMSAGALVLAGLPLRGVAEAEDQIAAFTGSAEIRTGDVKLTAPEMARNGNSVSIEVSSGSATEILLLAMGNRIPAVATFKFGERAVTRRVSTRIRLAGTQDVVAIARLRDGTFVQATSTVEVISGCCDVS